MTCFEEFSGISQKCIEIQSRAKMHHNNLSDKEKEKEVKYFA